MYDIENYYQAESVKDAVRLLNEHPDARIISGGSDVLIKIREGKFAGTSLVSIHGIKEIQGVKMADNGDIYIGAGTVFSHITNDAIIRKYIPVLGEAVDQVGGPQVRNIGTIGGNICNGAVSADSAPTVFSLNALLRLEDGKEGRLVPVKDFYLGPGRVDLRQGEILTYVIVPAKEYEGYHGHYIKYSMRNATDSYTNVVGKSISRDGITITLNEIVMDSKNLWIAYSDSEDSDADMKDAVEDKLLYTEVCINGQKIQQGLGQRTVNAFSENPITVEDFTIGEEVNTEGTVNIEFKVWPIAMDDADTWENVQKIQADTEPYTFKLATSKEELEKNTVDLNLNQNIKMDSNVLNLTEFRWNPFESTIYGMYHGTVYIDSDYYLLGTDDQGNKICYQETGRNGQETMFRQTIGLYPGYEEISPEANTITLQLYEVKNDTAHQVSEEKMDKDSSDDIYEESTTYVYDGGESPIDSAIPIGDNFTIQIR